MGSRHQLPWCSQNHVATSNRCRDITQANPGRDPPGGYPMSRHQFHVATSFPPTVGFSSRNTTIPGHAFPTATHVATSKMMSRPQHSPVPSLLCRERHFSMSRPPLLPPMSRHQNDVATWGQEKQVAQLRPAAHQPGRDATSWSRPHAQSNKVATSNRCCDLNRS